MIGLIVIGGQANGRWRKAQNRLGVGDMYGKSLGKRTEQGVLPAFGMEPDLDGADFLSPRMKSHSSSGSPAKELMAVADAEKGNFHLQERTDPSFSSYAPGKVLCNHAVGACYDDTSAIRCRGKGSAMLHVHYAGLYFHSPKRFNGPDVEIAE
jgi:hypothetical protein